MCKWCKCESRPIQFPIYYFFITRSACFTYNVLKSYMNYNFSKRSSGQFVPWMIPQSFIYCSPLHNINVKGVSSVKAHERKIISIMNASIAHWEAIATILIYTAVKPTVKSYGVWRSFYRSNEVHGKAFTSPHNASQKKTIFEFQCFCSFVDSQAFMKKFRLISFMVSKNWRGINSHSLQLHKQVEYHCWMRHQSYSSVYRPNKTYQWWLYLQFSAGMNTGPIKQII